jgi:DNA-binding NarL/FixJ family response regulator
MFMLIQIVDDSPNMRETIKSVLSGLSTEFIESSDGDEAIQQFSFRRPDVVIMDIRLERTDGIAATRAIRSRYPEARVIVVTQYDDDDLRIAARDAGASGYVLKDDLSDLCNVIPVHWKTPIKGDVPS